MGRRDMDRFLQEMRDRQRNIVPGRGWNGLPFYNLLWKGSSNPTPVQRIGVVLIATCLLLGAGSSLLQMASYPHVLRGNWISYYLGMPVSLALLCFGVVAIFKALKRLR